MKPLSLDPDHWGTIASTVCAVHCAVTGVAVSVLSVVGFTYLQSPILEWGFLGTAMVFGGWAAVRGYSKHNSWKPIAVFLTGFLLLAGSHMFAPSHGVGGNNGMAESLSVIGGLCLVGFHYLNRRFIKARKYT